MARRTRKRARSRVRLWPALLGLVIAAGIFAATYYGITRLLAGVVPAGRLEMPGLAAVEIDDVPGVQASADGSAAYFGELPPDYAFKVATSGISAEELTELIEMTDGNGSKINLQAGSRQNSYVIRPVSGDYLPGGTYKITLPDAAQFTAENLQPYRTIYFSIARDAAEEMTFQKNVVEISSHDIINSDGPALLLRSGTCKAGNILILPDPASNGAASRAVHVDTASESIDGLLITASEPALGDVFRAISLHGRYMIQTSQISISTARREGLEVIDLSGGNMLKIQAIISTEATSATPALKMTLTYEDQPEFLIDLQDENSFAFSLISNGTITLDYEYKADDAAYADTADLSRAEIISALQTELAKNPAMFEDAITLMQASINPAGSALSIQLALDLDLAAVLRGSMAGQLAEDVASTAGTRLFAGEELAFGSNDMLSSAGTVRLLGSGTANGALTLKSDISLLQFAGAKISVRRNWQVDAAGSITGEFVGWTSQAGQQSGDLPLGYCSASRNDLAVGTMANQTNGTYGSFDNLFCFISEDRVFGPLGTPKLPLDLSANAKIEFDETMTEAALPPISLQFLDLEINEITTETADPSNLLLLLDRVQLFVENGQLILPANLANGDHEVIISLPGIPDVKGSLTLTKVKPSLSSDLRQIARLLGLPGLSGLHKADAIALMGSSYTQVPAGADGWLDGYYYEQSGLTLCFYPANMAPDPDRGITEDDLDRVVMVYCEDKTDINDARVGMSPRDIKAVLGEPATYYPASEYFMLDVSTYNIGGLSISFAGTGEDVETQYAYITLEGKRP